MEGKRALRTRRHTAAAGALAVGDLVQLLHLVRETALPRDQPADARRAPRGVEDRAACRAARGV